MSVTLGSTGNVAVKKSCRLVYSTYSCANADPVMDRTTASAATELTRIVDPPSDRNREGLPGARRNFKDVVRLGGVRVRAVFSHVRCAAAFLFPAHQVQPVSDEAGGDAMTRARHRRHDLPGVGGRIVRLERPERGRELAIRNLPARD